MCMMKAEHRMQDITEKKSARFGMKAAPMTSQEFTLFSRFIENTCGIRMPEAKKFTLESRLQKRLRLLEMDTYQEYYKYLVSPHGMRDELTSMIDVVTTNKTDFFRESVHFSYLTDMVLPQIPESEMVNGVRIWSAGCSSGEEPYTLAMVLAEYALNRHEFRYSILATDICTTVLESARLAIYEEEKDNPDPHGPEEEVCFAKQGQEPRISQNMPGNQIFRNVQATEFHG